MADFKKAFEVASNNEGGYNNDPDDLGGETYRGIARKFWPTWKGWPLIDQAKKQPGFPGNLEKIPELPAMIEDFYRVNFWDPILGDKISVQSTATTIYDFAINTTPKVSISLAQMVAGATVDGEAGIETVSKINAMDPEHFQAYFALAKISRYIYNVKIRPKNQKYFYGWVTRVMNDLKL